MLYFDYDALTKLLTELSIIVGAKISIWNDKLEPTDAKGITNNPICIFIKENDRAKCAVTDNSALAEADHINGAVYYKCHFGFIEIMIKEYVQNVPFYFCVGPFKDPNTKERDIERIKEYCDLRHRDSKQYLEEYDKIPLFSQEKYESVVSVVNFIIDSCKLEKLIAIKDDIFESKIKPFLEENVGKNYTIEELCDIFMLPSKRFHQVVKKSTGLSPKQYITKMKIERAYQEIILTEKGLQEIASDVGIEDYNYFIKLFKSIKGHTPKDFRKEQNDK